MVLQNAPREHSAILSTFIMVPFVIKIFGFFFLFLSGRFTQVLLYFHCNLQNTKKKSFYKYQKYFTCPKTNIQFKRKVVVHSPEPCLLILILQVDRASFGNIYLLKSNLTLALFILLRSMTKIIYKVRFLAETVWFIYLRTLKTHRPD